MQALKAELQSKVKPEILSLQGGATLPTRDVVRLTGRLLSKDLETDYGKI